MRLVTFGEESRPGVVADGGVVDVSPLLRNAQRGGPEEQMLDLIAGFGELRPEIERVARSGDAVPLDTVRLRAPVPRPGKILAAIGNFTEFGQRETEPLDWFFKSPESVIGPGDTIELPPHQARVFHHEAELGVVIGRRCRNLTGEEAMSAVFGYTCFIDVSARDLGRPQVSTFFGKSFDTFGPMGPWVVTADEVPDPYALDVRLWVNGQLRQEYPLSDMMHRIPQQIAHATAFTTLLPGDVIACGTNHQGLSALQQGDVVEMEISGIGRLSVQVRDPLRRRWSREIDQEMAARVRTAQAAPNQAGGQP